ncbi:MASE1 domain-containing protein [Xenorhabdus sp. DI]|uniref:MASE1 domain-containing sensor histidine kinase n=1 Tax=Xenorhabdus doucetiae TaxID=351671 RepID=UPI0019C371C2|nr:MULTISPECIES: MASE1 domain-containing protein [unclassified Xenorhabdus]MBD2783430.1 MASE1 domain-containing protein [Xenorhabdus sp. 3]MBD2789053.1 MASE1 domain-containing protein [Xenorhabdus sp. DI]
MNWKAHFGLQSLFIFIFYSITWSSLWIISFYLHEDGQQAVLLLPQGLRLVVMILLWRRYLPFLIVSEITILAWLNNEQFITNSTILFSPVISLITVLMIQKIWKRYSLYWQQLSILLIAVIINSLLQTLFLSFSLSSKANLLFLASVTGGVLLSPFIYLIYIYLYEQSFKKNHNTDDSLYPQLRSSFLMWCFLFSLFGISGQFFLSPKIEGLLSILVFIPNVFMAYSYGWQGGVFSALLGSLIVAFARQSSGSFSELQELEIFLTTQALLGIGLGIAISRQQQLASNLNHYRTQLERELVARYTLMQNLVHIEEEIRKNIARELHDEIGQNITAIQIQSTLVKRTADSPLVIKAAEQIKYLSQQIHQVNRQLLRDIRPPALDEMSFEQAIHHLVNEFAFKEQNIICQFDYQLPQEPKNSTIILTLYRLIQELLNNISKHANASIIMISLKQIENIIELQVSDNGIGITDDKKNTGFGLKGIEERIRVLGGNWSLNTQKGTHVVANLPIDSDEYINSSKIISNVLKL